MKATSLVFVVMALAACSDDGPGEGTLVVAVADTSSAVGDVAAAPDDVAGTDLGGETAPHADAAAELDAAGGPTVFIHIRATSAPFAHADAWSGQTPSHHANGVRAFWLMTGRDDPSPALVFDHGDGFVEASYDGGADTVVGSARIADLPPGHYTFGRVVLSHMRYRVTATMHAMGQVAAGTFDNVQVLSEGVVLDGEPRPRGWFRYVFTAGGMSFPLEGTAGAPIPTAPTGAPIETALEDGQLVLYFPFDLLVDPAAPADVHQIIEFNVDRCFRWEDQADPGYAPGVFDTTATAYEPVRRFGANAYSVFAE